MLRNMSLVNMPRGSTYDGDTANVNGCTVQEGFGIQTWIDNSTYEGFWINGEHNGKGTKIWKDDNLSYTGEWKEGFKHGQGK